jgi:hypothetical protein
MSMLFGRSATITPDIFSHRSQNFDFPRAELKDITDFSIEDFDSV